LAALATEVLTETPWPADGQIVLWRGSASGVARHSYAGEPFVSGQLRDWTVAVRKPMLTEIARARLQAGQCETGGILAGTWDRDRKIIYIVGHFDPPPDSQHEPTGFVRGTVGVHRAIEQMEAVTAGNLTYIGEWHTHPPGYGSAPSADDRHLLRWVHDALQWSDAPALILIAGEDGFRLVLLDEGSAYSEFLITSASLG
jgi:integrative and conjugative element protein (TIGR02256 family)